MTGSSAVSQLPSLIVKKSTHRQNLCCSSPIILDSRLYIYNSTQAADVMQGKLFAAGPLTVNLTSTLLA